MKITTKQLKKMESLIDEPLDLNNYLNNYATQEVCLDEPLDLNNYATQAVCFAKKSEAFHQKPEAAAFQKPEEACFAEKFDYSSRFINKSPK